MFVVVLSVAGILTGMTRNLSFPSGWSDGNWGRTSFHMFVYWSFVLHCFFCKYSFFYFCVFCFSVMLGIQLRLSHAWDKHFATELHLQSGSIVIAPRFGVSGVPLPHVNFIHSNCQHSVETWEWSVISILSTGVFIMHAASTGKTINRE